MIISNYICEGCGASHKGVVFRKKHSMYLCKDCVERFEDEEVCRDDPVYENDIVFVVDKKFFKNVHKILICKGCYIECEEECEEECGEVCKGVWG